MPSPSEKNKKQANAYLKYSGIAFQMGIVIGLFAYAGNWGDEYWGFETPWLTILGSLLGVGLSLYILIRAVMLDAQENKDSDT